MKRPKPTSSDLENSGAKKAQSRSPAPPSRTRLRLFRTAALLLPFLVLGILEISLRLGGYGFSTRFFLDSHIRDTEVLTDNPKFGRWFFPPALARSAAPFSIPATRPNGTIRIFVLGESAAMGDPESAFSFSRILEVLLRARYPDTRFEIVNTGITAINTHAILPIARDCARHQGDIWVLYLGHNEVVGPFGAGTIFGAEAPPLALIRAGLAAKSLRITQWLQNTWRSLAHADQSRWGGMQMFIDHQVPVDDPRLQRVYTHFQSNLNDILHAGAASGAKLIVCTAGSNLKDCPPFASAHGRGWSQAEQTAWESAWTNATETAAAGLWREALEQFRRIEPLDPRYAELQFWIGRCDLELGDQTEAAHRFELARDLDTLRFRADSRINTILRQTAAGRTNEGIRLVDTATLLAAASSNGIPGREMFYEHVHLTFEGNYTIAKGVAQSLAEWLPGGASGASTATWLTPAECARRLGWDDWSRYRVLREIRTRLSAPPFTGQLGHVEQMAALEAELRALAASTSPAGLQQTAQDYQHALVDAPDDPVLHNRLGEIRAAQGDVQDAIQQWQAVARLLPHRAATFESLGTACGRANQAADARKYFTQALALDPESTEAWNGLGVAFASEGRFAEAAEALSHALRIASTGKAGIRLNLARTLEGAGKFAEAERQYRLVLEDRPGDLDALLAFGHFLVTQQRPGEAREILQHAVQAEPRSVDAHLGLGVVLEQFGNPADAAAQFREVLRLDPENPTARAHVAVLSPTGK